MEARDRLAPIEELLHKDHYTPEELARLLDMDRHQIEQAVFRGELKAVMVEHHIHSITRAAALDWLRERG